MKRLWVFICFIVGVSWSQSTPSDSLSFADFYKEAIEAQKSGVDEDAIVYLEMALENSASKDSLMLARQNLQTLYLKHGQTQEADENQKEIDILLGLAKEVVEEEESTWDWGGYLGHNLDYSENGLNKTYNTAWLGNYKLSKKNKKDDFFVGDQSAHLYLTKNFGSTFIQDFTLDLYGKHGLYIFEDRVYGDSGSWVGVQNKLYSELTYSLEYNSFSMGLGLKFGSKEPNPLANFEYNSKSVNDSLYEKALNYSFEWQKKIGESWTYSLEHSAEINNVKSNSFSLTFSGKERQKSYSQGFYIDGTYSKSKDVRYEILQISAQDASLVGSIQTGINNPLSLIRLDSNSVDSLNQIKLVNPKKKNVQMGDLLFSVNYFVKWNFTENVKWNHRVNFLYDREIGSEYYNKASLKSSTEVYKFQDKNNVEHYYIQAENAPLILLRVIADEPVEQFKLTYASAFSVKFFDYYTWYLGASMAYSDYLHESRLYPKGKNIDLSLYQRLNFDF